MMGEEHPDGVQAVLSLEFFKEKRVAQRRMGISGNRVVDQRLLHTGGLHLFFKAGRVGYVKKKRVAYPANGAITIKKAEFFHRTLL
jgi:hypothetical protein